MVFSKKNRVGQILGSLALSILLITCNEDGQTIEQCPPEDRVGAFCRDGSTTTRTDKSACANHGGVGEWRCSWGSAKPNKN